MNCKWIVIHTLQLMGHLDLLPILAKGINIYLPFLILLFCALTYYKWEIPLHHNQLDILHSDWVLVSCMQLVWISSWIRMTSPWSVPLPPSSPLRPLSYQDAVSAGKALVQLERNKRGRRDNRSRVETTAERPTESSRSFGWKRQREDEENVPFVEREEIAYDPPVPSMTRGGSSLGPSSQWTEHPNPRNIFDDM